MYIEYVHIVYLEYSNVYNMKRYECLYIYTI